ncbi:MAG: amidohydrolase family protein [Dermatophilaceae bacterium]
MSIEPNLSARTARSTLYRGGCVYGATDTTATAMLVADDQIAWIGSEEAAAGLADGVAEVCDLAGALVTSTFVDAHVHISATGMRLRSCGLSGLASLKEALDRVELAARRGAGRPIYAPDWDEDRWPERRPPTAHELDRASYGGVVYSPRVDGHSAVISSALAAASGARNHPGWNENGLVTREAHHAARDSFYLGITPADRRADIDAALLAAAAAGIGLLHENGGPTLSSEADFGDVLEAGAREDRPQVIGYWAELVGDAESARTLAGRLGARGLGGDLNIDGSIGSRTASLREPYTDAGDLGGRGNAYLTAEQVRDHVVACSLAGIQAGFHVIGDSGVDTAVAGLQAAAAQVGMAKVIEAHHRLEHLEMVDAGAIKALVELGVTASVQPAFDAQWGGSDGMYAARLGRGRAGGMNPFATMIDAGLALALGTDSPVTPFGPWETIAACVNHHDPAQRISARSALLAHTVGGWRAAGIDDRGYLDVGQPASFAIWSAGSDPHSGLPDLSPGATLPTALRTVIRGRTVFDRDGALS